MASFAVGCIARDEAPLIEEWIAFHLVIGAAVLRVCVDTRCADDTRARVARAARKAPVELIDWHRPTQNFELEQRAAYREGARALAGTVDFAAFIDADEFIFAEGATLGEALDAFGPEIGAVAVGYRQFGSSGQHYRAPGLLIERFLHCAPAGHPSTCWFSTIARPEAIADFDSCHSVVLSSGAYVRADGAKLRRLGDHPGRAATPLAGAITAHHYGLKSREEFAAKAARWADTDIVGRYGDGYFERIDSWANQEYRPILTPLAPAIRDMIARFQT